MAGFLGAMSGQASSQFPSTASELFDASKIPRSIFGIHKQQQELLDKEDSWAQYLARQPKPGVSLPADVLENLRQFYRRQKHAAEHAVSSLESSKDGESSSNQDDNIASQASQVPRANSIASENVSEDEDVGSKISWSSSPEPEDKITRPERSVSSHESPKNDERTRKESVDPVPSTPSSQVHEDYNDNEVQPFMSQVPARSPPLPPTLMEAKTQQRPNPKPVPAFNDFPSSSLGVDDELEVVAPNALTVEQPAAKKSSQSNPTPPSAQVQVPCTYDADSLVPRRPCKDVASIQKVQERLARKQQPPPTRHTPLPRAVNQIIDVPDSQSSVDSTSSVIPSTNFAKQDESPDRLRRMQPLIKSTIKETPRLQSRSFLQPTIEKRSSPPPDSLMLAHAPDENERKTPEYNQGSPHIVSPSPKVTSKPASPVASSDMVPLQTSSAPFVQYCLAYPNYTGSLQDFLSACLCIPRRRLATYQYDDFIRAWKEGYLPYVEESGEGALVAIDWYMETIEDFPHAYQAKIVTRTNLKMTLEAYPEEVAPMKPHEVAHKSQTHEALFDVAKPAQDGLEEARQIPSMHTEVDKPEDGPPSRRPSTSSVGSKNRRMQEQERIEGEEEISAHVTEALEDRPDPVGVISVPSRKRQLDEEGFRRRPKRRTDGATPPSEASALSSPVVSKSTKTKPENKPPTSTGQSAMSTASTGRKKKGLTAAAFKKFHLEKKKKRNLDNISIASSAPPEATPGVGQRGKQSN